MKLDSFINKILENVMCSEKLNEVKDIIKKDMASTGFNYETAKVECQVLDENNNYDPRVEISNEGYSDGEVIFIDFHLDDNVLINANKKENTSIKCKALDCIYNKNEVCSKKELEIIKANAYDDNCAECLDYETINK